MKFAPAYSSIILLLTLASIGLVASSVLSQHGETECKATEKLTSEVDIKSYNLGSNVVKFGAYIIDPEHKYINLGRGVLRENESSIGYMNPKMIVDYDCGQLRFDFQFTENNSTYVSKISGSYYTEISRTNFYASNRFFEATRIKHSYQSEGNHSIPMRGFKDNGIKVHGITLVLRQFSYDLYGLNSL